MFKISKELMEVHGSEIEAGKEVKCYDAGILHNTKHFNSVLFATIEAAKKSLEKFAEQNPRIKANLVIVEGTLQNSGFSYNPFNTVRIRGVKQGKEVAWQ